MEIYKYTVNYSGNIVIREIEVTEKNVIYVDNARGRIRKDEIDKVNGRALVSCRWCYMYSLSKDKVDFFKDQLIKKLKQSKADYEKNVKTCENEITTIEKAIIKYE